MICAKILAKIDTVSVRNIEGLIPQIPQVISLNYNLTDATK